MSARSGGGRPTANWLPDPALLATLPAGTAVLLDVGKRPRMRGRLLGVAGAEVALDTPRGEQVVAMTDVKRARVVAAVFEEGDPVLRVGVSAAEWRGGVVRSKGTDVLVETLDGFVWLPEAELESPESRDVPVPAGE